MNTLIGISSQLRGESTSAVTGSDAEQLRRSVQFARARIWTGKDDRLLRKLDLAIRFNTTYGD